MSLCQLIDTIEAGTFEPTKDTNLSLAIRIQEELAAGGEDTARRQLFGDARQLANHIIEKYLALDQETRQQMANFYEDEEYFDRIGLIPPKKRVELYEGFGEESIGTIKLLNQISNYSKLIPVLTQYIKWVEGLDNPSINNIGFPIYLKKNRLERICRINFHNDGVWEVKKQGVKRDHLESLTYGIPEELKQQLSEARSLLKQRTKTLREYIAWTQSWKSRNQDKDRDYPTFQECGLYHFMRKEHNSIWNSHDFRTEHQTKKGERNFFASLTHNVSEELKQCVADAINLLPYRTSFLEEYITWSKTWQLRSQDTKRRYPNINELGIYKFMKEKKILAWGRFDFHNNQEMKEGDLVESITCDVPQILKEKVKHTISFLAYRMKLLKEYVTCVEQLQSNGLEKIKLLRFLQDNNLASWYKYDFRKHSRWKADEKRDLVASLTYDIQDQELVAKVRKYAS